jgi:hypothetical protein
MADQQPAPAPDEHARNILHRIRNARERQRHAEERARKARQEAAEAQTPEARDSHTREAERHDEAVESQRRAGVAQLEHLEHVFGAEPWPDWVRRELDED